MIFLLDLLQLGATALLIYIATKISYNYARRKNLDEQLDANISRAVSARQGTVEWARGVASRMTEETRREIVGLSFSKLQESLQSGALTAESVLTAYIGAALKTHQETNCITLFLKESLDEAQALDRKAADSSFVKMPFFGIPMSVKETPGVRGSTYSFGGAAMLTRPKNERDPFFVAVARENGAIPFCLTNTPLSLMAVTTINPVYGTTRNPHRKDRSAGGSSGGEGAIIGGGGSIFGLGSDLGGSIRIPAANCGCAGFRPSYRRQSMKHYGPTLPGRPFVWPTDGPMARSIDACVQLLRITWQKNRMNTADPFIAPVNFREDLFAPGRKYRIGYYTSTEYVTVVPAMEKAVLKAKKILEKQGHEFVLFNPPGMTDATRLAFSFFGMDGLEGLSAAMNNDRVPEEFKSIAFFASLPLWVKYLIGRIAKLFNKRLIADQCAFPFTGSDVQKLIHEYYTYRNTFTEHMESQGIDAVMSCPTPSPALKVATPMKIGNSTILLTAMYNMLDFAAGVVKVSEWTEEDDRDMSGYNPKDDFEIVLKEESKGIKGLPIAVQVASPPYRDEIVLRILTDLEEALKEEE